MPRWAGAEGSKGTAGTASGQWKIEMNRRLITVLLFSAVIAGICALVVARIMGSRMAAARPISTTKVVAAARDLKIGDVIAATDLTTVAIAGSAPKGALTDPKDAIGRGVISVIDQDEPIFDDRLAPKGSGGGLAATIPPGMRACAVKVDQVVGVAGFATPGMRVDVLVSGDPPGSNQQNTVTRTVLQNIEVLSAGTDIQKDAEGKPQQVQVVNLLVTPEQAQTLSLASNQSQLKIQLVLRNPIDTKVAQVQSTAMSNLFGQPPAPAHVRREGSASRKLYSIVVMNGSATSVEKFPTSGGQQ
jgi:pilus assembly protein CpaB